MLLDTLVLLVIGATGGEAFDFFALIFFSPVEGFALGVARGDARGEAGRAIGLLRGVDLFVVVSIPSQLPASASSGGEVRCGRAAPRPARRAWLALPLSLARRMRAAGTPRGRRGLGGTPWKSALSEGHAAAALFDAPKRLEFGASRKLRAAAVRKAPRGRRGAPARLPSWPLRLAAVCVSRLASTIYI